MDVYYKKPDPTASVVRKKKSVLNGKTEMVRGLLDAKATLDPARDILFGNGSVGTLNDVAPLDFFWTWYWPEWGDLSRRNYTYQGWEKIDGRDCLRFQIDKRINGDSKDQNYQRFWIDVDRNAHVVRMESHTNGKLVTKTDISLFELPSRNGQHIWLSRVSASLLL